MLGGRGEQGDIAVVRTGESLIHTCITMENIQLGTFMSTVCLQRGKARLSEVVLFSLRFPGVPEDAGGEAARL